MRRRDFIAMAGSIVTGWPFAAGAQRRPMPLIGYLDVGSREARRDVLDGLHRGLAEAGYVEGVNFVAEYRWAPEDHVGRLSSLASELVRLNVDLLVAVPTPAAQAAKAATRTIPIVFATAVDPIEAGLVVSLSRPGGNATGMTGLIVAVAAKRVALLHELLPTVSLVGYLINPANPTFAGPETREVQIAAKALGLRLLTVTASDPLDFEPAFETLVREQAGAVLASGASFFTNNADRLAAVAARFRVPAMYARRDGPVAGGLISFGTDFAEMYPPARSARRCSPLRSPIPCALGVHRADHLGLRKR
jgi:putative tryptophan/tyrosine transport system substrate-binding protein